MFCKKCGTQLEENSKFCPKCGEPIDIPVNQIVPPIAPPVPPIYQQVPIKPQINSTIYLVFSILATVLCCLPFGIPAIVYAIKINTCLGMNDEEGAKRAAKISMIWSIVSAATIVLIGILYIVLFVIIGISAGSNSFTTDLPSYYY